MPRIPLIEDLTTGPIPAGSNLIVEYDPTSLWYGASLSIASEWLSSGGEVGYSVAAQPPDNIRAQLLKLGMNLQELETSRKLEIYDWYSATLGQKSKEKYAAESLKATDLSIMTAKATRHEISEGAFPEYLRIWDNCSVLARFNDDKAWVELLITRTFPRAFHTKSTLIVGVMRGIHSDWVYRQLEDAADGVVDFKLEEDGGDARDLMRIRSIRSVTFDRKWYDLRRGQNFEVILKNR